MKEEKQPVPCYKLQKNDIFRIGRVKFKVREIMSPEYLNIERKNSL